MGPRGDFRGGKFANEGDVMLCPRGYKVKEERENPDSCKDPF
jgi:hypothetical protein